MKVRLSLHVTRRGLRNLVSLPQRSWVCGACRVRENRRRQHTLPTTVAYEKPYYITTPIFYVNAAPHVGHLYNIVLTDILKRWQVLKGKKAILCTGTDEHGMKVQQAASKAGQDVRAFCDQSYQSFKTLAERAEVDYDHFIRTSEPEHRFAVQHFWLMLKERGYIYSSKHEGWYSISDETFYPASGVHLVLDPATGRKHMASIETGKEVEWTSENNYHFRLSTFQDRLLDLYKGNPKFVVPDTRMADVIQAVSSGLEDLSVSRPAERLSWGIPVPDDETQTIYVWLDALINYLTKSNYPFQIPGKEDAAGWPADCHVIGKDIVRFHCIYWPAFLMALDLPLPRQILTHGHWTLGHVKMAKSTGNVVNPFQALGRFGVDTMRYYLAHDGGIQADADYENGWIIDRYKKGLRGGLGNLASRITRGRAWNVRNAVKFATTSNDSYLAGILMSRHAYQLKELSHKIDHIMTDLHPGEALKEIMSTIYKTNKFITDCEPWGLAGNEEKAGELNSIVYLCAESLRICGILLQPYMPQKMQQLLDMLGVAPDARSFKHASLGSDSNYGTPKVKIGTGNDGYLFPPLTSDK